MDCRAACVVLRYFLIFLYHTVPCLSKTSHDLAPGDATALGTALGPGSSSFSVASEICDSMWFCDSMILWNPQPFQSDDLRFIPLDPELFLKPCCATGNAIPYVFSKSRRGFRVSRWKIKALLGGACGLTIQLDKLSFPCNLNILAQNFNHAGLHKYILTL